MSSAPANQYLKDVNRIPYKSAGTDKFTWAPFTARSDILQYLGLAQNGVQSSTWSPSDNRGQRDPSMRNPYYDDNEDVGSKSGYGPRYPSAAGNSPSTRNAYVDDDDMGSVASYSSQNSGRLSDSPRSSRSRYAENDQEEYEASNF